MANDKKFVVKNGLTTQNISFVDSTATTVNTINLNMTSNDALSFSGESGQLFSIADSMTGSIFTVNDISGIPSIEVIDTGLVKLAEFSGNVLLGTPTDNGIDKLQVNGAVLATTFKGAVTGNVTGNATTATTLQTARTIGGVSFDGSANINLPGVNTTGNQNTTGSAATLTTARTIGGVSFDGSANINLPGVNTAGNQNTTGSAATLTTARTINGTSFDGSANITTANWGTARTLWGQSVNGSVDITAPLLPAAGNAALPAFSTSGDTNTGMYFPAADTIAFSEGGVEAMRINDVGNVGIGITAPAAKLQVDQVGIQTTTTALTTTTQTIVYSYAAATFRTAELICQIVDSTNTQYHSAKFFIIHNGTDVWFNQTNVIHSHNELGTFTVNISGGNVRLLFTSTAATTKSIKVAATMLTS